MKKTVSVILSICMFFSLFAFSAAAVSHSYEISSGETIEISAIPIEEDFVYVKFVPEKTAAFRLSSLAGDGCDPACVLFDGELNELLTADDEDGYNFILGYEFTAGETYYFGVCDYSGPASWEITLECSHLYEDGKCIYCEKECEHKAEENDFLLCDCGKVFAGKDISLGEELEAVIPENPDGELYPYVCIRFVPENDGTFMLDVINAPEESDSFAELYDSEFNYLFGADDENGMRFSLAYSFTAGEPYYFLISDFSEAEIELTVKLDRAVHDADDGKLHELVFTEAIEATCIQEGFSEGLYCPECDIYVRGHESYGFSSCWDGDFDLLCDYCGNEIEHAECTHICHSEKGFLAILWRIVCFFCRIFGIEQYCECGAYHY